MSPAQRKGGQPMATAPARATIDDLYRVEGKAELIGGRIVEYMATGFRPQEVAANVFIGLKAFGRSTRTGVGASDNLGYVVAELPSGRESFNPDASFYSGRMPSNLMRFIEGPPTFAVEVRSENDYGGYAESEMAAKRDDYFQAGTLAVWDVDPVAEEVRLYLPSDPANPTTFVRGQVAHAGTAVPGWSMPVDDVFATDL